MLQLMLQLKPMDHRQPSFKLSKFRFMCMQNVACDSDSCTRKDWQLLRVLQIFVEHTIDYVPAATILYAMRMHTVM